MPKKKNTPQKKKKRKRIVSCPRGKTGNNNVSSGVTFASVSVTEM